MADTGFRSPGTAANADRSGGVSWSSPGNIVSSNNVRAIADIDDVASDWLRATNFGFTIPTDATIDGIEIAVERHMESGGNPIQDQQCFLRKSTGQVGTDWANTSTNWPTSDGTATYGGPASLFGTTWTPTEINDSAFGLDLSARKNPTSGVAREARVDHIQIKVYYTEAGGEPVDTPVNVTAHLRLARRITKAASTAKTGRLKFAPSLATALSFGRAFTAHVRFGRSLPLDTGKVARAYVRTGPRLSRAAGSARAAHLRFGRVVTKNTATANTAHLRFAATLDSIKATLVTVTAYLRLATARTNAAGKPLSASVKFARALTKATARSNGAYLKFAQTFDALKSALVTLTAYVRLSARRTHSIDKPLSAHLTLARTLTKSVSWARAAHIRFAAALVAANAFSRAMTAYLRVGPALTRSTGKPLSAATSFAGSLMKAVSLSRAAYIRFRLTLTRAATVIVNLARWIVRDAAAVAYSARHALVSVWTVADTAAVWTASDSAVSTWTARDSPAVTWAASDRVFVA